MGELSTFARCLGDALTVAGWTYQQGRLLWRHEAAGLWAKLDGARGVVLHDGEDRWLLSSKKRDQTRAALDVAEQLAAEVRLALTPNQIAE